MKRELAADTVGKSKIQNPKPKTPAVGSFLDSAWNRILIFDGGMGTAINPKSKTQSPKSKVPCPEWFVEVAPEAVEQAHADFLAAGADVIETLTLGGAPHILAEHKLDRHSAELNRHAAEIARASAFRFSTLERPRFVAGSIGPGSQLPSLGHITFKELVDSYSVQVAALIAGGVDCLIVETCQDLLQVKAALVAIQDVLGNRNSGFGPIPDPRSPIPDPNPRSPLPVMVSVTVGANGTMLLGTDMSALLAAIEPLPVAAIGFNCGSGPKPMAGAVRYLAEHSSRLLSIMPNAGKPRLVRNRMRYDLSPRSFARQMREFALGPGLNIAGGCCGTTPEHIRLLAEALAGISPRRPARPTPRISSLYQAQEIRVALKPLLVGERMNASGSRRFRDLLQAGKRDAMAEVAQAQERDGAHLLDLSVAAAGRDERKDMSEFCRELNVGVRLPVMIDSTRADVIEAALQRLAGRSVINSINLEDEARARRTIELCRKYGAALVCMAIDRGGMAMTAARKLDVARRLYALAVEEMELAPDSIFFDFLTFTLGSGEASLRAAARETLQAIRQAKRIFPRSFTILGVSNVSHGLATEIRRVLNSVFLQRAIEHGLDAAIVHVGQIRPLSQLPAEAIALCDDVILNRRRGTRTPLERLLGSFSRPEAGPLVHPKSLRPEEQLRNLVRQGSISGLDELLEESLKNHSALAIIERYLMPAMTEVGRLFEQGKMQLPFVLRSAEVMHRAFAALTPRLGSGRIRRKRMIVLATVRGDIHDIGKNLVKLILTSNGFGVVDLGVRVPPGEIIRAARKYRADAIGLSGLLVESARAMKEYLDVFAANGITLPVICGGAALSRHYVAAELQPVYKGKVHYAKDAMAGLKLMQKLATRE